MRCIRCGRKRDVYLKSYNAHLCRDCLILCCQNRVRNTIDKFKMCNPKENILVAVSGGKDSLVLWDILNELGYNTFGIHIDLGIEGYSPLSKKLVMEFAEKRNLPYKVLDIREVLGLGIKEIVSVLKRPACRICGLIKRYLINVEASEFDCVATGHNLDDEAGALLGNILNWQEGFLSRQYPVLEKEGKLKKKIKPLCFNLEEEIRYYADFRGIEYVKEPCPLSKKATSSFYKEVVNSIERKMPATKIRFYKEFIKKRYFKEEETDLFPCEVCGFPTTNKICGFCRLKEELNRKIKIVV